MAIKYTGRGGTLFYGENSKPIKYTMELISRIFAYYFRLHLAEGSLFVILVWWGYDVKIFRAIGSGVPAELYPFLGNKSGQQKIDKWLINKMLRKLSLPTQTKETVCRRGTKEKKNKACLELFSPVKLVSWLTWSGRLFLGTSGNSIGLLVALNLLFLYLFCGKRPLWSLGLTLAIKYTGRGGTLFNGEKSKPIKYTMELISNICLLLPSSPCRRLSVCDISVMRIWCKNIPSNR